MRRLTPASPQSANPLRIMRPTVPSILSRRGELLWRNLKRCVLELIPWEWTWCYEEGWWNLDGKKLHV
jgi:hypothetical protein